MFLRVAAIDGRRVGLADIVLVLAFDHFFGGDWLSGLEPVRDPFGEGVVVVESLFDGHQTGVGCYLLGDILIGS